MRHLRLALVTGAVMLLVLSQSGPAFAGGPTGIAGHGTLGGRGGWNPTVHAQLMNGVASGSLSVCHGCAGGPVFQIVPPSAPGGHWCIAAHRDDAPGNNVMLYILDVGDGDGVDKWGATSTFAPADCTTFPSGFLLPLDHGNFHGH